MSALGRNVASEVDLADLLLDSPPVACAGVLSPDQRPPASMIGGRSPHASNPIRLTSGLRRPSLPKAAGQIRVRHADQP